MVKQQNYFQFCIIFRCNKKKSYLPALCISISKMVQDKSKVTVSD